VRARVAPTASTSESGPTQSGGPLKEAAHSLNEDADVADSDDNMTYGRLVEHIVGQMLQPVPQVCRILSKLLRESLQ
jgi:hypothetical protein